MCKPWPASHQVGQAQYGHFLALHTAHLSSRRLRLTSQLDPFKVCLVKAITAQKKIRELRQANHHHLIYSALKTTFKCEESKKLIDRKYPNFLRKISRVSYY